MSRTMFIFGLVLVALAPAVASTRAQAGMAAGWVESYNSKVRLLAGKTAQAPGKASEILAGVEVRMAPGWKTYWRMPGDAGGIPPQFDWSASENLLSAKVLYPAPHRLPDAVGDSIGYMGGVVFPVKVTAKDPSRPVELRLSIEYGICREICVPAEAKLALSLPPEPESLPPEIEAALSQVPRGEGARQPRDPKLAKVEAHLEGDKPKLVLEVLAPGGGRSADLFVEGSGDIQLSVPAKVAEGEGWARFEIDLTQGTEPAALKGKTLLATIVSDAGQSEASFTVE